MKIVFEKYWKYFKKPYYQSLQKQRYIRKLSITEIKDIQWKRLKKILDYIYNNNEFYRNQFESVNLTPSDVKKPEDMLKLPITEKRTYKKYFQKIISKDVNENDYNISCTSGSSGEPFEFYVDNKEDVNQTPAFTLNKEAMGVNPYKKRNKIEIKIVTKNEVKNLKDGVNKNWNNYLRNLFFSQHIGLCAHDIKYENTEDIIRIIKDNKIERIYGYSSSILSLAGYLSKYKEEVNLKYIILIGEGILKQQRDLISKNFHCPVYLDYGASECMRMGFECKNQNGYHMDIYNYYFEYLKNGIYAKNDEVGEIVVTNLNNYVFPFIRYRIGDAAAICNKVCKCGTNLPIVKNIHGRITDIIITPTNKEISQNQITVGFKHLHKYIRQYQVIQIDNDKLLVLIVPTEIMNEEKKGEIYTYIYELTDKSMNVQLKLVEEIDAGESGKKRGVISKREYLGLKKNNKNIF